MNISPMSECLFYKTFLASDISYLSLSPKKCEKREKKELLINWSEQAKKEIFSDRMGMYKCSVD